MLDVITDFWKPVKKQVQQETLNLQSLQVGSSLTFGTVPQALLSNQRFEVTSINTYQFGEERMISFILTTENAESVSLIVANADGDSYLALSRRISLTERMRMFDPAELEAVAEQPDAMKLTCREIDAGWRHWLVSSYKKEISGLRGSVVKSSASGASSLEPFDYMLLTSDNNEYAIEIERYTDGRLELYATIYRRVTDIVEMDPPHTGERRLPSAPVLEVVKSESPKLVEVAPVEEPKAVEKPAEKAVETAPAEPVAEGPAEEPETVPEVAAQAEPETVEAEPEFPAVETPVAAKEEPATPAVSFPSFFSPQPIQENRAMQAASQSANGSASVNENERNRPAYGANQSNNRQEIKVSARNIELENDAIECALPVANKIIEEAIRNERPLSDVVRRIIALPVANPESVQIPITLADADFQLLGIRYGIPAADRNAIRNRIIDEINEFCGSKKQ